MTPVTPSIRARDRASTNEATENASSGSFDERRPFRASAPNASRRSVRVIGKMPSWLDGQLLRTAPAVFRTPTWEARNWFDGLGVVYSLEIRDGRVHYQSRLLQSEALRDVTTGGGVLLTFDTRARRPLLKRLLRPAPRPTDNANINIVALGAERVALTESPHQLVVDPTTLETTGRVAYSDGLPKTGIMSAHPQLDVARGTIVNTLLHFSMSPSVSFYEHAPSSRVRRVFARFSGRRIPYVHSFGLTDRHAVLIHHPFDAAPHRLLFSNNGFVEAFDWRPEEGTKVVSLDRDTGEQRVHLTDPMFVFHTVHAFELVGETVVDVVAHDSPDIITSVRTAALLERRAKVSGRLLRLRLVHGKEHAIVEPLSDGSMEFPVIDVERAAGRPEGAVWGATVELEKEDSAVVRVDTSGGATRRFQETDMVYGEPVFVADPSSSREGDGVLLTVGSSLRSDHAALAVLDATTLEVLARAEIDDAVPFGLHGSFFPNRPGPSA